jgi:hypothetical protein
MIKVDRNNIDAAVPKESDKGIFVTIFTDGSHCPHSNAWGVGVWICYSDNPPIELSEGGVGYKNAFDVECHGIKSAVNYAIDNFDLSDMVVVIQCDNIGALNKVVPNCTRKLKAKGVKFVKAKHVKAHTSNKTSRTRVNDIVDKLARKQMELYRGN